ncbi:O-antigen/teichoic acid export membrane protein [Microbacterium sp. AG157]|nr:O-antigen/teichoic acid export membrane protein [Microbacterium sp. AG157]
MWNLLVATAVVPLFAALAVFITSSNADAAGVSSADANALALLATLMLACLLISPFASALIGAGLLPVERRNQSIGIAVRCAGTLTACLVFDSIVWLAAAEVVAAITPHAAAVATLAKRKLLKISFRHGAFSALRKMLRYSIRSFGVALVGATILQLGTVVVGSVMGPSDVTYYNAAFRVYTAARQLLTWIVDPFRSTLSRQFVEDPTRARRILTTLCAVAFGASALGAGVLVFGASDIVHLWLGASVPAATIALTMIVFLIGFVINSIQIPMVPAGDALGRPGAFFLIQLTWLVAFAVLSFPLVDGLGIVGAALALSAPLAFIAPLYLWRARSVLELGTDDWRASGIFAIVAVVVAATTLASVAAGIQFLAGLQPLSLYSTLAFAMSAAIFALILRKHLPAQRFVELLRAKL